MNGIIALDIDGTVTAEAHQVPVEVVAFLEQLHQQNWTFLFITGRTFKWAYSSLAALKIPYYLAVQNGAILLNMPERKIIKRCYVDKGIVPKLSDVASRLNTDFIIYSGYENDDTCYYRPKRFSKDHLEYLFDRTKALHENWQAVEDFTHVNLKELASLKFIEKEAKAQEIARCVEEQLHLHIPINNDPYNGQYFVAQATHPEATKGSALKAFAAICEHAGPIIAAGDDFNDVSMLEQADIKIVMGNAPGSLLLMADIIAPPVSQMGIITGLKHAIHMR